MKRMIKEMYREQEQKDREDQQQPTESEESGLTMGSSQLQMQVPELEDPKVKQVDRVSSSDIE